MRYDQLHYNNNTFKAFYIEKYVELKFYNKILPH